MNNDEDSIWFWMLAVVLGIVVAAIVMAWPLVAWWIMESVFK